MLAPAVTPREQAIIDGMSAVGKYMADYHQQHGTLPDDPWGGLSVVQGPDGEQIDLEWEMQRSRFGLGPPL